MRGQHLIKEIRYLAFVAPGVTSISTSLSDYCVHPSVHACHFATFGTFRTGYANLVIVLIKPTLIKDLGQSAFSIILCLPADFFLNCSSNTLHQVTYVTRLKETMKQLQPTPTDYHGRQELS